MSKLIKIIKRLFINLFAKGKDSWKKLWYSKISKAIPEGDESYIPTDEYDSMFSVKQTNEGILVSKRVYDQIKHSLPNKFTIPNPNSINLLKSMRGDSYDNLFNNPYPTPSMFIDCEVWGKVINNLPEDYLLPTPTFEKITKPVSSEYYDSLFSQPPGTTSVFVDGVIWERIAKNLPKYYTLPNPTFTVLVNSPNENRTANTNQTQFE